jgi:hypothetical protein
LFLSSIKETSMSRHNEMPPVPPANRSHKGTGDNAEVSKERSRRGQQDSLISLIQTSDYEVKVAMDAAVATLRQRLMTQSPPSVADIPCSIGQREIAFAADTRDYRSSSTAQSTEIALQSPVVGRFWLSRPLGTSDCSIARMMRSLSATSVHIARL